MSQLLPSAESFLLVECLSESRTCELILGQCLKSN